MSHVYDSSCACEMCGNERNLRRRIWAKALDLCRKHEEITNGIPCELCQDTAARVDSIDPVLHALGRVALVAVREDFAGEEMS